MKKNRAEMIEVREAQGAFSNLTHGVSNNVRTGDRA